MIDFNRLEQHLSGELFKNVSVVEDEEFDNFLKLLPFNTELYSEPMENPDLLFYQRLLEIHLVDYLCMRVDVMLSDSITIFIRDLTTFTKKGKVSLFCNFGYVVNNKAEVQAEWERGDYVIVSPGANKSIFEKTGVDLKQISKGKDIALFEVDCLDSIF